MAHKGLKFACVAICCFVLLTILIVPSFALEGDSRAVDTIVDNQFYMFDNSNTDTSLYYVDCAMSRFYVLSLADGSFTVYNDVTRIWFSNSGLSITYYVGTTMNGANIITTDNYQDVVFAFDSILGASGNNTAFLRYLSTTSYFVQDVVSVLESDAYNRGLDDGSIVAQETIDNATLVGYDRGYRDATRDLTDGGTWSALGDFMSTVVGSFVDQPILYGVSIGTIISLFVCCGLLLWILKVLR